jgi:hypothetical protein
MIEKFNLGGSSLSRRRLLLIYDDKFGPS